MTPSPELARWLSDPAAQAVTTKRSRRFAEEVLRTGRLADFACELDGLASDRREVDRAASVRDAVRRLLVDPSWPAPLLDAALAHAAADPFFEPPFASIGGGARAGLVLLDHPLAVVTLSVMTPAAFADAKRVSGGRSIGFTGTQSMTRFVRAGGATIAFYRASDQGDDFRSEIARSCRRLRRRTIADGEIVAIDGRTESFVIEAVSAPVLMVAGELRAAPGSLAREYDAASLAFVGASAADEACSRVQLMLSLLRVLRRTDAGELFAQTVAHAPFFLRWQAMREYLALDARAALPALTAMAAQDPHPEVRTAALRTLAVLRVRHPALFVSSDHALAA